MSTGNPALRRYSTYFLFAFSIEPISKPKFTFFDLFTSAGIFCNALAGLSGVFGFPAVAVSSVQQTFTMVSFIHQRLNKMLRCEKVKKKGLRAKSLKK